MPTTPITYAEKDIPEYLKYGAGFTEDEITNALAELAKDGGFIIIDSLPHGRVRVARNADGLYDVVNIDKDDDDPIGIVYVVDE